MCFVREAINNKKSGLVMEIFCMGSHPPPLIFRSYGTREAKFNFGHKKGEKLKYPKTPKVAIFNINHLGKVITLYFHQKFPYCKALNNVCNK